MMEDKDEFQTFCADLVRTSTMIARESKRISELVMERKPEDDIEQDFVNSARATAKEATTLNQLVNNPPETKNAAKKAQLQLLKNSAKECSEVILALIQAARSAVDNPYDYQTKQDVVNTCRDVALNIKSIRSVADSLSAKNQSDVSDDLLKKHAAYSKQTIDAAKSLLESFGKIDEAAKKSDKNLFLNEAKNCARNLGILIEIVTSLDLENEKVRLKESSLSYISSGKAALRNPDEFSISQLEKTRKKITDELQLTLIAIQSKLLVSSSIVEEVKGTTKQETNSNKQDSNSTTKQPAVSNSTKPLPEKPKSTEHLSLSASTGGIPSKTIVDKPNSSTLASSTAATRLKQLQEAKTTEDDLKKRRATMTPQSAKPLTRYTSERGVSGLDKDLEKRKSAPNINATDPHAKVEAKAILFMLENKYKVKISKKHHDEIITAIEERLSNFMTKSGPNSAPNSPNPGTHHENSVPEPGGKLNNTEEVKSPLPEVKTADSPKPEEDASLNLEKITALESYAEWRKMTISRKQAESLHQKADVLFDQEDFLDPHTKINPKKGISQLKKLSTETSDFALEFIVTANEAMLEPKAPPDRLAKTASDFVTGIQKVLYLSLSLAQHNKCHETVEKIVFSSLAVITQLPTKGELDTNCLEAATSLEAKMLDSNLQKRVFISSNAVRILSQQFLSAVVNLIANAKPTGTYLTLCATAKGLGEAVVNLLNFVETSRYLSLNKHKYMSSTAPMKNIELLDVFNDSIKPVWDDEAGEKELIRFDKTNPKEVACGSLNNLIRTLTSAQNYDSKFMHTFITTYQSFTTPWVLFDKLIERYNVPKGRLDQNDEQAVKLRVCIVLKHWVEHQFFDLDEELLQKIHNFVNNTLPNDNFGELSDKMSKELARRIAERTTQRNAMFTPPSELKIPQKTSKEIFVNAPELDIARQLTLIDYNMYACIEPSGLLNQSWNKPKLQYRAPSIIAMISRANKVSFWVAGMILNQEKPKDRRKLIEKFVMIAENLKKLNNFHTLMGIIAGLNTSSVTRLKETRTGISSKVLQSFNKLEQIMHPMGSFKAYRESLHNSSPPCLPYIGTYLTDLTFIEDGNPDEIDHLINFSKRQLVYNVIAEVQQYQQSPYDIKEQEPLYSYLAELPTLTEKQLYDLSLHREARTTTLRASTTLN